QNFCGMCGAPLLPGMVTEPEPRITEVPEAPMAETYLTEPVPPQRPAPEPIYSRAPESRLPVEPRYEAEPQYVEETQELNMEGLLTRGLLCDRRQGAAERREPAREMPRATTQSMIYADDPPAAITEPLPSFREQRAERSERRPVARESDVDWLRERQ